MSNEKEKTRGERWVENLLRYEYGNGGEIANGLTILNGAVPDISITCSPYRGAVIMKRLASLIDAACVEAVETDREEYAKDYAASNELAGFVVPDTFRRDLAKAILIAEASKSQLVMPGSGAYAVRVADEFIAELTKEKT